MAIEIIELTTCTFCREGAGAIYLDAHAVSDLYDDDEDDIPSIENHTQIIRYNSSLSETKPCQHLVQIAFDHFMQNSKVGEPALWRTGNTRRMGESARPGIRPAQCCRRPS